MSAMNPDWALKNLANLVAYHIDDALHIDLRSEGQLDSVDHGQFGSALVGFGEEAPGFSKQPGVFERHTRARGERREHAHVDLRIGIELLHILKRDNADHLLPDENRHAQPRLIDVIVSDSDGPEFLAPGVMFIANQ